MGTDRMQYAPGDTILVMLRLSDAGRPLLGASVRARIAGPADAELELRDDGLGGDETAGDGVYTARFTGTDVEGTYTFMVYVDGVGADGVPFRFSRRTQRVVHLSPDPAGSPADWYSAEPTRLADGTDGWEFAFRPRNRLGDYLGPGFADRFEVDISGGEVVGVVEERDGAYVVAVRPTDGPTLPAVEVRLRELDVSLVMAPDAPLPRPRPQPRPLPRRSADLEVFGAHAPSDHAAGADPLRGLGLRLAVPILGELRAEAEVGAGVAGDDEPSWESAVLEALAGLRLDLPVTRWLVPSVAAGAGAVRFSGPDEALEWAAHASASVTLWPARRLGIRATGRTRALLEDRPDDARTMVTQYRLGVVLRGAAR